MIDAFIGKPVQQLRRVVVIEADVHQLALFDGAKKLRHGIDEGLHADEARRWIFSGTMNQMFATAKTDFQADGFDVGREECGQRRRCRCFKIDFQQRQKALDAFHLLVAQRLALAPAIERFRRS